jgi:uncharacterized protein (TIGR03435 family)
MCHILCVRSTPERGLGGKLLAVAVASLAVAVQVASAQVNVAPAAAVVARPTGADGKPMEFDVISVKPNKSGTNRMMFMTGAENFSGTNIPLMLVVQNAYNIKEDLISGAPGWVTSDRFDVEAKVAATDVATLKKLNDDQQDAAQQHMLQTLLADRFKLQVHKETKQLPIYELVIAKGGLKLKQATPGDTYANGIKGPDGVSHAGMISMRPGQFTGQSISLSALVDQLARRTHRTVVDKTGLTGNFDVTLNWTPDDGPGGMARTADDGSSGDAAPDLFTAVQEQLGLKLQPAKGPVETLVVDHVERPTEN